MNAHQRRIARRKSASKPQIKLQPYQLEAMQRIREVSKAGSFSIIEL